MADTPRGTSRGIRAPSPGTNRRYFQDRKKKKKHRKAKIVRSTRPRLSTEFGERGHW